MPDAPDTPQPDTDAPEPPKPRHGGARPHSGRPPLPAHLKVVTSTICLPRHYWDSLDTIQRRLKLRSRSAAIQHLIQRHLTRQHAGRSRDAGMDRPQPNTDQDPS